MRFYVGFLRRCAAALPDACRRHRAVRRVDLRDEAAADRLHAREDASRIVVAVELPPGATLEDTHDKTDRSSRSAGLPEVSSVFVLGGTRPTGPLEDPQASLYVQLVPKTERSSAKGDQGHHRRQARGYSGRARLVRQRARRARAFVLDAVAPR